MYIHYTHLRTRNETVSEADSLHTKEDLFMMSSPVQNGYVDCGQNSIIQETCLMLKNVLKALFLAVVRFFVSPPRKSVKDEIVLVTGSGHGMGRCLAVEFSKLGAVVVLWDINERDNLQTAKIIQEQGGKCHVYTCDVSEREQVYAIGQRVKDEVGEVFMLINNAGIVSGKKFLDIPDDMVEKTFSVNLLAHFWTVKCFLPSMLKRNHGHIVNISSSAGLTGLSKLTDYSASKFGVVGFTEVLNYEIVFSGYTGVCTTLVCPAFVKTGMFAGCKMRFPSVLPPLEIQDTVDRIVQGILTDQQMICLPRLVYFFTVFKALLPTEAMLDILKFFGCGSFMDTFVGRKKDGRVSNGNHGNNHDMTADSLDIISNIRKTSISKKNM